jgi:hypothetical protein
MKDRILTLFCLLGMLLSFGVLVSWARSMMNCEGVTISHHYIKTIVEANQGSILFGRFQRIFDTPEDQSEWRSMMGPERLHDEDSWSMDGSRNMIVLSAADDSFLGFTAQSSVIEPPQRRFMIPGISTKRTMVQVPHWFLLLLIGGFPTWWLMHRNRLHRDRTKQGLCHHCGFEMGALYHLCPKCGERAPLPEGFSVIQTH